MRAKLHGPACPNGIEASPAVWSTIRTRRLGLRIAGSSGRPRLVFDRPWATAASITSPARARSVGVAPAAIVPSIAEGREAS